MNVEFIPAFYAAFHEKTAIAEIRPGIDEVVGIGRFRSKRDLKVFDFTVFAQVSAENSRQVFSHTRYEFINQMEGEISKPIKPYDKQREYIPTQIVAEYLGEFFGCDAVIYRSSMVRDNGRDRRNIVLLNKGGPFVGEVASPLEYESFELKKVFSIEYDARADVSMF